MSIRHERSIQAAIAQAKRLPENRAPRDIREGVVRILESAAKLTTDLPDDRSEQTAERIHVAFDQLVAAKSLAFQLQFLYHPVKTIRPLRQLTRKIDRALDALEPLLIRQGVPADGVLNP